MGLEKALHVLVTDDSYKAALGIVRSLGRKGIRVSVLADSPVALASRSKYCSARYVVPPACDGAFIPSVLDILRRVRFDLLMPVGYTLTASMAQHKAELSSFTRVEVVDHAKVRTAADKRHMYELATTLGVPTPRTVSPTSLDDAEELSTEFQYPVVIKASCETPGAPVYYAGSRTDFLRLYRTIWAWGGDSQTHLPVVQEFIPGFGCGFFALYQNGACKRIFMHKRIRETPPSGGVSCCAMSFYDPKLKDYGTRLLDRLEWHGVAMVEFRYDKRDGDYKLMEINPKFWGSLDLALTAGVDFPYYICQMAQGHTIEYSEDYDRDLRYHWPLLEMQHLWLRPASIGAVLADVFNPRVKSNFSLLDIKPNLLEPLSRARARLSRLIGEKWQHYIGYPAFRKSSP